MTIKPENGIAEANSIGKSQASKAKGRPVMRKDVVKAKEVDTNSTDRKSGDKRPLHYGSGEMVDGKNLIEVRTFQRYVFERKTTPESKIVVLAYYRQQLQVPVSAG